MKNATARVRLAVILVLMFLSTLSFCQGNPTTDQGALPYAPVIDHDIDSVNMVNGKLFLNIPLASYTQRGGKLHLSYHLEYEDPIFTLTEDCSVPRQPC